MTWQQRARCRDYDPESFFPAADVNPNQALKVCRACPVRTECLSDAIDVEYRVSEQVGIAHAVHGVRGGLTRNQRLMILRVRRRGTAVGLPGRPRVDIRHGTEAGAGAHRRRGEKPCQACLDADAAASRERRAKAAA